MKMTQNHRQYGSKSTSGGRLGGSKRPLGPTWRTLGVSWDGLGHLLGHLGRICGRPGVVFWVLWDAFGHPGAVPGGSCGMFSGNLGRFRAPSKRLELDFRTKVRSSIWNAFSCASCLRFSTESSLIRTRARALRYYKNNSFEP